MNATAISVPRNDEIVTLAIAWPARPCCASGWPSSAVAAEAGAPSTLQNWLPSIAPFAPGSGQGDQEDLAKHVVEGGGQHEAQAARPEQQELEIAPGDEDGLEGKQ